MKNALIFFIILALHLMIVFFLGIYGGLAIGNQTFWEKAILELVQFPLVTAYKIFDLKSFHKDIDGLWSDPFTYVIVLNSSIWAFVITFIVKRHLSKYQQSDQ